MMVHELEVAPEMAEVPLYHCHARAETSSVSESGSENEPLLQVTTPPI